jgi:hypothetical protein
MHARCHDALIDLALLDLAVLQEPDTNFKEDNQSKFFYHATLCCRPTT